MKRPEISNQRSDPDLVGRNEQSSWVQGRNGVYNDNSVAKYRVSINTGRGWKTFGHFYDVETATYIANIAILAEGCEERYELNRNIGEKDKEELGRWRSEPKNVEVEKTAAQKFKLVKSLQEAQLKEEKRLAEVKLDEQREQKRLRDEKIKSVPSMSNPDLIKLIKDTKEGDPLHDTAMREAVRRFNNLGLGREP